MLSSLSNFIVALALARGGSAAELGSYTLIFSVYVFAIALIRALVEEPLLAMPRDGRRADSHDAAALGVTIALSSAVALAIGVVGGLAGRSELVVLALGFVPLALQDLYRYSAFRGRSAYRACAVDTAWVIVCAGAWTQLTAGDAMRATSLWVLGGVAGLVVGLSMERWQPLGWHSSYKWWRHESLPLGGSLVISWATVAGGRQVAIFVIAAMLGEAALGSLRAGQLLVSPIVLGLVALNYVLVPPLAQRAGRLRAMHAAGISALTLSGVSVVAAFIWFAQDWIHETIFDGGVRASRVIIAAVLITLLFSSAATGYTAVFKAKRWGRPIAVADVLSTAVMLPLVVAAAYWFGINETAMTFVLQPATSLMIFAIFSYQLSYDRSVPRTPVLGATGGE